MTARTSGMLPMLGLGLGITLGLGLAAGTTAPANAQGAPKQGAGAAKPAKPAKPAKGQPATSAKLAPAQPATPAPITVVATPFHLAAGKLPAPVDVTPAAMKLGACELTPAEDGWDLAATGCGELAKITRRTQIGHVTIVLETGSPLAGTFRAEGGKVHLETKPAMDAIALPTPTGWKTVLLTDGATSDGAALQIFGATTTPSGIWGTDASRNLYELSLGPARKASGGAGAASAADCPSTAPADWCAVATGSEDELICIDATNGFDPVAFSPKRHVLLPNRSLSVVVLHAGDRGVELKMQGTRGLYEASVADYTGGLVKGGQQQGEGARCKKTTRGSFAPRTPGSADVKIEVRDLEDRTKLLAEHTVELEVATTYAGAIRLGFASVFGDAVDRAYAAQTAPGSSTPEIARTESGDVNLEVVVGLSAYVFDLAAQGGRTYVNRPVWSYLAPSPYLGIGVIAPKAGDGIRPLASLHFGLEWEVTKSFAVGIDAVARRVTRLTDGFSVGSPVGPETMFTEERYEWGWSLTFSVSPEFFQLAMRKP